MIKNNLFFWGAEQLSGINQILNLISTYFVNSGSERKTISKPISCRFGNWARLALASRGVVIL